MTGTTSSRPGFNAPGLIALAALLASVAGAGCASTGAGSPPEGAGNRGTDSTQGGGGDRGAKPASPEDFRGLERAEARVSSPSSSTRPAAVANGTPIARDELWPLLAERGGREVLEEVVLDGRLHELCRRDGVVVSEADRENEKARLLETMSRRSGLTPIQAEETLLRIRTSRGLGPERFARLLERNAMLRKLSAPEARVLPSEIELATQVRFGAHYAARVILVKSEQDAAALRARLETAPDPGPLFSRLAREHSLDPSASSGGVLPELSTSDPTYPSELRSALRALAPGQISPVVAADQGFAIVLLDEIIPPLDAPSESDRSRLETDLRVNAERTAMERLAERIVRESGVTAMDPSLRWSWETRR